MQQEKISVAVILLHPHCNMFCNFCVTEEDFSTMTFEQAEALLQHLEEKDIHNIVIGGGEPFYWPHDVLQYTRLAKERGFFVQVGTNGVALPKGFENIQTIDRYVLPLESDNDEIHNGMRFYNKTHHAIILERLEALKNARRSVTLSTVITQTNINDLENLALYLKNYNQPYNTVHAWHLYQFIPLGRGGLPNAHFLKTPPGDYERVCQKIKKMDLGFPIYKRRDMYHSKTVDFFWHEGDRLVRGH